MKHPKGIGTNHHSAKMNTAKVRQARKSFATGRWTQAALARKYGISGPSMAAILQGRTWKHVA
ncbi:hypothetical protein [Streptomyces sp. NPDC015131]|uniref:hypothetical protein n=1 Tax=Streptomyces sp. NPDC015131 TaxID=3364941 RepID=UPI0036F7B82A